MFRTVSSRTLDRRPVLAESLADRVFQAVKRDIVEIRLPPDTIIAEGTLAARHEVSRAPAREALKRLAAIGFVRAVPRVGYIVTTISVRDFDDIFALRLELEPMAVRLAVPRLTDADVDTLQRLNEQASRIAELPVEQQGTALAQLNAAFHHEIVRVAGNTRLERIIAGLLDELERIMHMLARSPAVELVMDEHPQLLATMASGDADAAAALMGEQLAHDYRVMRELALESGGRTPTLAAQTPSAMN
jgi:DNA-binding GntR family transcriptional regulator